MCSLATTPVDQGPRYTFEPLTYYRNDLEKRVFLLIHCPVRPEDPQVCWLLEWGKSQNEAIQQPAEKFQKLIDKKQLIQFTPKYPDWQ